MESWWDPYCAPVWSSGQMMVRLKLNRAMPFWSLMQARKDIPYLYFFAVTHASLFKVSTEKFRAVHELQIIELSIGIKNLWSTGYHECCLLTFGIYHQWDLLWESFGHRYTLPPSLVSNIWIASCSNRHQYQKVVWKKMYKSVWIIPEGVYSTDTSQNRDSVVDDWQNFSVDDFSEQREGMKEEERKLLNLS